MKLLKFATALLLSVGVAAPAFADSVEFLGQTKISRSVDRDRLLVQSCARMGATVSHIRFRVMRNPMTIYGLRMNFGDGTSQGIRERAFFPVGTMSGWIPLIGGRRCLHSLEIMADGHGGKSIVQFWGVTQWGPYSDTEIQ